MKVLLLLALGLGLTSAAPLSDARGGDTESAALKTKLETLRDLLGQLSHKVKEKAEAKRTFKTKKDETEPFLRDLDDKDVAILKGMRDYFKNLKDKQDEAKEKREEEETVSKDVRELLQKFKSRVKYLKAALDEEEKDKKETRGLHQKPDDQRALTEVEKRLLNDLQYAHEHGVDIRQVLQDLQAQRKKH